MSGWGDEVFSRLLDLTEPPEMAEHRRRLLRDVRGEILEIGMGTGANLPFYPPLVAALTVLEPREGLRRRAERRTTASGQTMAMEWYQGRGEHMPFEPALFDAVVTADVLCSVEDVAAVLAEAYRVLKPGGRLHFLEHGLAREDRIRKWQTRLDRLHAAIGDNCHLTREMEKHLRSSRFAIEELVYLPPFSGFNALYTHIRGTAVKAA